MRFSPRTRARASAAGVAAAIAAAATLLLHGCTGCIGILEFGDPGDGIPVEFPAPAPAEATP